MKLYCGIIKGPDWYQTERIQQYVEAGGLLTLVDGNTEDQFKKCASLGQGKCSILIGQQPAKIDSESPLAGLLDLQANLAIMRNNTRSVGLQVEAVLLDIEQIPWPRPAIYIRLGATLARAYFPSADVVLYRNAWYAMPPVTVEDVWGQIGAWDSNNMPLDVTRSAYEPIPEEVPTPRFYLEKKLLWLEASAYVKTFVRGLADIQKPVIWVSAGKAYFYLTPNDPPAWLDTDPDSEQVRAEWLRKFFSFLPDAWMPGGFVFWPNPFHSDAAWATFETLAGWRQQS